MEGGGFEPPKSLTTDLQSAPFGHSGTPPFGAGDRNRTNNLLITNQLLCLLSYTSILSFDWCLGADSNHRHRDFQSLALPTELPRHGMNPVCRYMAVTKSLPQSLLATRRGLEPLTSSVTGWRTNQLYYRAKNFWWAFTDSNRGPIGYEPTALTN